MLKQTQSQKLSQKILPQIIQRQSLLAVPSIALEQMIKSELEQNPLLEEIEEDTPEETEEEKEEVEEKEEEFDYDDLYSDDFDGYNTHEYTKSRESINYDNIWKDVVTLQDSLLSQLHVCGFDDKQTFIGEFILGNIDDDGYLRESIQNIQTELEEQKENAGFGDETFSEEEISEVLKTIQGFDPVGVASINLKECLLTQLREMELDEELKELCIKVLENNFEEFRLKNYEKIMRDLKIDKDKLNRVFEIILKLNPKPGFSEDNLDQNYIYPDLIVTKVDDEYKVYLNDRNIPSLRVNHSYRKMVKDGSDSISKEAKEFIHNNFDRAKWYIEAINSRRETMIKVMNSILIRQFDFFENMGEGLKPMYEKDVAEDINMDISTVSRTIRGKYVQTDFGTYELKYFFSNYMTNEEGDDVSTKEIKKKLKEVIESEDSNKPLTDDKLAVEMEKLGFKLARRTVAKYREAMNIPKARLRRKF